MLKYTVVRLLQTIIVLIGVTLVTFILVNVVPGDPVAIMFEKRADPVTIENARRELGLDRPLYEQYFKLVRNAVRGDFGRSFFQKRPVSVMIASGFRVTATLGFWILLYSCVFGVLFGISAAVFRGKAADKIIMFISTLGMCAPSFWIAIILQIVFGVWLDLLPISRLRGPSSYILPTLSLGVIYSAYIARLTRTNMLEALNQDYIRTARAKGLGFRSVIFKHGLKNAAIPIVTYIGILIRNILGGSVLVETVFSINGLGRLMIEGIMNRDIPVIQGCSIYIAFVFVMANLIIDLLYGILDPRIRVAKRA